MARYFGADIITFLETILTSDLNTNITTINTSRSESAPLVKGITSSYAHNYLPECFIDITGSTIEFATEELNNDITRETELYTGEVVIAVKSNLEKLPTWCEIYVEALQKTLHGYEDTNITWIVCTGTVRESINTRENQTYKIAGVQIEIRVN
jgi:hypothetical protein